MMVDTDRIPHAMMLSGPSGVGKMMLARAFANYLHCQEPRDGEPCGHCQACLQHRNFNHPDLHFVFPFVKSKTRKIIVSDDLIPQWKEMLQTYPAMPTEKWLDIIDAGNSQPRIYVEEADAIVRSESLPAYSSKYKIFIIWLPERMQVEAANKLLKVVEEPPEGTIFLFVSNDPSKVLPTIISRTQSYPLSPLPRPEIEKIL